MDKPLEKAIDIIVKVADPDKIILFGSRARGV
jgi:predicted nucleotidyltransferase